MKIYLELNRRYTERVDTRTHHLLWALVLIGAAAIALHLKLDPMLLLGFSLAPYLFSLRVKRLSPESFPAKQDRQ